MPTERRPNLFIVGAQKSGTSALAGLLDKHHEVVMSFPKEPGYLAFGEAGYWYPDGNGKRGPAWDWVVRSEAEYLDLFAEATPRHSVLAEASTWYFALPGMARRLHDYNPDTRIVVSLRNPVDRAYSAWCHARRDDQEPCEDFAQALAAEEERGEVNHLLRYHFMGRYSEPLREYQSIFNASQLLVLFYDDFRNSPEQVWDSLCEFLQIDNRLGMPVNQTYNRSGQPRSRAVQAILRSHGVKAFMRKILPQSLLVSMKQQVDNINLKQFPPMDEGVRAELKEYYRQDVEELMKLTGRDLAHWLK